MPDGSSRPPDTGYYVYGVVPVAGGPRPRLRGIDDAEVAFVEHEQVAAAASQIVLDRPPGRRAELLAHTSVVDALAAAGAVLPVRFGSILEDRDSVVHELLAPAHDRFVDLLANLDGCRQFNLRATYVADQVLAEVVRTHPEIAELRRRTRELPPGTMHPDLVRLGELVSRAMENKRADDAEMIMDTIRPLVLDESPKQGGGVDHLVELAFLVEDERIAELEEGLEELAEAVHERIRLRLTGPVAPYDFAEASAWA
ncbi:MAG: GvpL/GvpF family gas vesicle protein [Marmoricola sp.]